MFQFDPSRLDDLSRRQLMADMAKYCLGVTILPAGFAAALDAADKKDEKKPAATKSSSSGGNGGIGPGYLGAEFAPVPVGDPALGLQNTSSPKYLTNDAFDKRMELSHAFDSDFRKLANKNRKVNGYDDLYKDAIHLLRSEDLK